MPAAVSARHVDSGIEGSKFGRECQRPEERNPGCAVSETKNPLADADGYEEKKVSLTEIHTE